MSIFLCAVEYIPYTHGSLSASKDQKPGSTGRCRAKEERSVSWEAGVGTESPSSGRIHSQNHNPNMDRPALRDNEVPVTGGIESYSRSYKGIQT